jgi:hypothetical protein
MQISHFTLRLLLVELLWPVGLSLAETPQDVVVEVRDTEGLRRALASARPGQTISLAPGRYRGGLGLANHHSSAERVFVIRGAEPANPPVIEGGGSGLHLSAVSYVELSDLVFERATGNGLNIDDAGLIEKPSHHITLRRIQVRDIGDRGNQDGIKLSGVDDFVVDSVTVERWGEGGSGIDMVGCHRGRITGSTFRHLEGKALGANGVQAKGGSAAIVIQNCRFEHAGGRGVNLGGSTGLAYIRPADAIAEATDLRVEKCTFIGGQAAVAFVGVDGAVVSRSIIYLPAKWCGRILQENRDARFVPCRKGRFEENIIVFRQNEMRVPFNIGPGTLPDTFQLARNAWYCIDNPARSRPDLTIPESDPVVGVDPRFEDPSRGDFRLRSDSPLRATHDR